MPHLVDGSCNVHHLLLLDLLQDVVNADEGPSTTNTSTGDKNHSDRVQNVGFALIIPAVYQYRSPAGLVLGDDPLVEGQHGGGVVWDSMVRPGGVVELLHL